MLEMLVLWLVAALALLITSAIVPGFRIGNFGTALVAALVVGLANVVLRPLLLLLTLPINILTLGLFTFVVNAVLLKLAAALVADFEIRGWFPAILGAVVLAIVRVLLFWVLPG